MLTSTTTADTTSFMEYRAPARMALLPAMMPMNTLKAASVRLTATTVQQTRIAQAWQRNSSHRVSPVGVVIVLYRWKPPGKWNPLPSERLVPAIRIGIRYARHASDLQAALIRTGVFITFGSALWALMPLVARFNLGLGAAGYGILLGAVGLGSLFGAGIQPYLRRRAQINELVTLDDAAWFFGTGLGRRLWAENGNVEREVAFVSRVPPERLDSTTTARDEHDVVLLRGMVDVVLDGPQGLEIIDYKTDDVSADQCSQRADAYRSQMDSYAEAIGRIYCREVGRRYLVFLTARQVVALA